MKLYQEKNKVHVEVETSSFRGTLHLTPSGLFTPWRPKMSFGLICVEMLLTFLLELYTQNNKHVFMITVTFLWLSHAAKQFQCIILEFFVVFSLYFKSQVPSKVEAFFHIWKPAGKQCVALFDYTQAVYQVHLYILCNNERLALYCTFSLWCFVFPLNLCLWMILFTIRMHFLLQNLTSPVITYS